MKEKIKFTFTATYEADSCRYGNCDFVEDMIEIDKKNFEEDPLMFIEAMIEREEHSVKFEKVTP